MDQTVSPTPARTVPDSAPATSAPQLPAVALPAPVAPAAAPAAAAPSAAATAPPALASNIGPSARSTPESGTVTGAAQPAAPAAPAAPRRVGPRVDASWAGNAAPAYPLSAKRMGEQGTVRLDVHVGADGGVLEVQVRQSSGSAALDRAASEGVRKWRFRPATVDGQPVAEWYRNWEWVFKLEG